jgi:hypothetical protein
MTFWNKVREDMSKGLRTGMKQGVSALKEGSNIAAEKAGQMAEMGKIRYQIFLLEQQIEKNFSEMGSRIYDLIESRSKAPLSDGMVKKNLMEAKKLEKKIKLLQGKMEHLRKKAA